MAWISKSVYQLKSGKEIYMDGYLVPQLDSLVYNIKHDWDFVILITGDRQVRTGKSTFAQTICAYLADRLNVRYDVNDIYFDSQGMIEDAQGKPPFSINHLDEGRESLDKSKTMMTIQKDLLDFFSECGQLNHIFVIVLPDFFGLKEEMAVARSEFLFNVYRSEKKLMRDIYNEGTPIPLVEFGRGNFTFFNRSKKALMYDISSSTKKKHYGIVKANFFGKFINNKIIPDDIYRAKKLEWLNRFKDRKANEKLRRTDIIRDKIIINLRKEGMSFTDIEKKLAEDYEYVLSDRQIRDIYKKYKSVAA